MEDFLEMEAAARASEGVAETRLGPRVVDSKGWGAQEGETEARVAAARAEAALAQAEWAVAAKE